MQIIKHSNECRVRMLIHSGAFTMGGQWYKVLKPYYIAYRKNVNKYSNDLTATKRPEGTCKLSHGTLINHYIFQYICYIRYIISILSWLNISLTTTFFMRHVVSSTESGLTWVSTQRCSHEIRFARIAAPRCLSGVGHLVRSIALRTSAFQATF